MNSIYTERENILPHHAEWLDGCGATWNTAPGWPKVKFSSRELNEPILAFGYCDSPTFTCGKREDFLGLRACGIVEVKTGTEFCERVAEILGLPKPTFEVDISKKETTIKGMAIEVGWLNDGDREWLVKNVPDAEMALFEFVGYGWLGDYKHIGYQTKDWYQNNGYTITESPTEFLEYVAKQTGKEYKVEVDPKLRASMIHDSLDDGPSFIDIANALKVSGKDDYKIWNYPHKTYRILDSLDGIPFDKRIPLSEWIPPFGVDVNFIHNGDFDRGNVHCIAKEGIIVKWRSLDCVFELDGHWMRIV
ncbi:unnamed protein product [Leptospira phage LE1]|uniref:Uncharacterized protein n=1 Tax=Leptospira phage LE1 TaxID=137511 RepID=Q6NDY3_9CAUD|nr:hypothetical protein HWD53_gp60 [Leptospira phage LE1]CAE14757.1 unnamed protein product [Leptospira phage LE1]